MTVRFLVRGAGVEPIQEVREGNDMWCIGIFFVIINEVDGKISSLVGFFFY